MSTTMTMIRNTQQQEYTLPYRVQLKDHHLIERHQNDNDTPFVLDYDMALM